jgi:hypothetical protein
MGISGTRKRWIWESENRGSARTREPGIGEAGNRGIGGFGNRGTGKGWIGEAGGSPDLVDRGIGKPGIGDPGWSGI